MSATHTAERLEIRHRIDAPIEVAFNAWVDPDVIGLWWGPEGFDTTVIKLDARVDGEFVFRMTSPSGDSCPMTGIYLRVEPPCFLSFQVLAHCVADLPDSVRAPASPSQVDVSFTATGDTTEIVLVQTGLATDYQLLAEHGWGQSLQRIQNRFSQPG